MVRFNTCLYIEGRGFIGSITGEFCGQKKLSETRAGAQLFFIVKLQLVKPVNCKLSFSIF